ncbi:MAG: protein kinase [Clostridia bacterium]|nr:protein kinase [Clostridia bacterium]
MEELLPITKGNVELSLKLILPIIKTLKKLSELPIPIYHRDLKPDNILYKRDSDDNYALYLADFGTCFLKNDEERITPNNIAVGARMFMSPEYEVGRVENVDETGDIFSIGKIIWCMINGEKNSFLPSNFWFIDEYDLSQKFKDDPLMISANLIISSCLNIKPEKRCKYKELINMIEETFNPQKLTPNDDKKMKVKQYLEKRNIEFIEILKKNKLLVNIFSLKLLNALKTMMNIYPEFYIFERIHSEYLQKSKDGVNFTTTNIDNNSAHYLYSSSFDNAYISINYHPASKGKKYANITFDYRIRSNQKTGKLLIEYDEEEVIVCSYNQNENMLSEEEIMKFLEELVLNYIE